MLAQSGEQNTWESCRFVCPHMTPPYFACVRRRLRIIVLLISMGQATNATASCIRKILRVVLR